MSNIPKKYIAKKIIKKHSLKKYFQITYRTKDFYLDQKKKYAINSIVREQIIQLENGKKFEQTFNQRVYTDSK